MNTRIIRLIGIMLACCAMSKLASAQIPSVIDIKTFDFGQYDVYGEGIPGGGQAGRFGNLDGRSPYRNFLAFHVPQFTGTLTKAELILASYYSASGDAVETLRWSEVATPVNVVRGGGFGLTNVYADLGDGPVFSEIGLQTGCCPSTNMTLTSSALDAITSARGGDFAMGGSIVSLGTNAIEYIQLFDWAVTLRLTVSAPFEPVIHTPLAVANITSNFVVATIGVSGASPMTYRWFANGSNFLTTSGSDASAVSANVGTMAPNASQSFFVVASNAFGSVTSQVAQFKMPVAAVIFSRTNVFFREGDVVQLSPYVNSFAPGSAYLQWRKDGAPIPGQNFDSLYLLSAGTGDYTLVVSNSAGAFTSAVVRVQVSATPPVFWQQPADVAAIIGDYAQLSANPVGSQPLWLQWYHNGSLVVAGGPGTTVDFNPLQSTDAGDWVAVASNHVGMSTSRVAHVTAALDIPVFNVQPANQTIYFSGYTSFHAQTAAAHVTYRWFHNGVLVPNENSSILSVYNVSNATAGPYFCTASNSSGMATSQVATLTIISLPPILSGLVDLTLPVGANLAWPIGLANPPAVLSLIFEKTNVMQTLNPLNSTAGLFLIANLFTNWSGHYVVVASNQFGVSTSRVATLTITAAPPTVALSVIEPVVVEGSRVTFSAWAQGFPTPALRLFHNGNPVPPVTAQATPGSWSLLAVTLADAGNYTVVASNLAGVATATVSLAVSRGGPLDKWTIRNPLPQGRTLHGIVWAQNQFVAVGDNGALVTSPDGTNWVARNTHTEATLRSVAHGNGRFVVVGTKGAALTSTNGETWELGSVGNTNVYLNAVTFGNSSFLGVGSDNLAYPYLPVALQSTNGSDWSVVTIPQASLYGSFWATAFGGGRFSILPRGGRGAEASTDRLTWTNNDLLVVPVANHMAYLNGNFLAVGYEGTVNISSDGISWSAAATNAVGGKFPDFYGIAQGAGRYVIVMTKGRIITSTGDLHTWTSVASPTFDRLEDVIFAGNLFVAVGENGTILTSTTGLNWSNQTRGVNFDLDGLGVGNGLAVAVGKNGTILTSTEGTIWSYHPAPGFVAEIHGAAYGDGRWVAVGESTNILTSTDGVNWTAQWPGFAVTGLKGVVHANGQWVAVGVSGQIITSPDAITWTQRTSPVSFDLNEVTYGNGMFVIVGDRGDYPNSTVLTSSDGVAWADHTYYSGKNARGIAFANGTFVMANNDGLILYTTNPVPASITDSNNWRYGTTGIDYSDGQNLRGLTWSNSLWLAVGNNGLILTSTNAQTWRRRRSPTYENLHAVRYINNTFIAIGNQGVIVQSAPLTPQLFAEKGAGNLRLTFSSPYEGVFKLQQTENFAWQDYGYISNQVGTVEIEVPLPSGSGMKFYRVVGP